MLSALDRSSIEKREEEVIRTKFIDEVEIGHTYELVITNYSGLYRYRLGDVIKIVDFYNKIPVMEFQYRLGQILNVKGEKTSEQMLLHSLSLLTFPPPIQITEFTSIEYFEEKPLSEIPYYSIYIELSEDDAELPKNKNEELDEILCNTNPIYESFRVKGAILPLSLNLLRRGTMEKLRERMIEEGAGINQVKIPRVLRHPDHIQFVKQNVM